MLKTLAPHIHQEDGSLGYIVSIVCNMTGWRTLVIEAWMKDVCTQTFPAHPLSESPHQFHGCSKVVKSQIIFGNRSAFRSVVVYSRAARLWKSLGDHHT
jgi:hypothetical protein